MWSIMTVIWGGGGLSVVLCEYTYFFVGPSWSWSYGSLIYNATYMQSVPIIINVVSSSAAQAIQHYVIKIVSDLRQVGGFLWVPRFTPPIKLTATI